MLKPVNNLLLCAVVQLFDLIVKQSSKNQMTASNLGIAIGPTLFNGIGQSFLIYVRTSRPRCRQSRVTLRGQDYQRIAWWGRDRRRRDHHWRAVWDACFRVAMVLSFRPHFECFSSRVSAVPSIFMLGMFIYIYIICITASHSSSGFPTHW